MAEKRLKDRLTLKFLSLFGLLYSEEDSDDFKQPRDAGPNPDYVPPKLLAVDPEEFPGDAQSRLSAHALKRDQPERWDQIVSTMRMATTYEDLKFFSMSIRAEVAAWPLSWRDQLAECYEVERDRLKAVAA